jgi:hypothetical protein
MSDNSIQNSRRSFIKQVSFASILLASGKLNSISAAELFDQMEKKAAFNQSFMTRLRQKLNDD